MNEKTPLTVSHNHDGHTVCYGAEKEGGSKEKAVCKNDGTIIGTSYRKLLVLGSSIVLVILASVSFSHGALARSSSEALAIENRDYDLDTKRESVSMTEEAYLNNLEAVAKQKATFNKSDLGPSSSSYPHQAKFPSGVFDILKADDKDYLRTIRSRCTDALALNSSVAAEVLGCRLYFDVADSYHPIALGPLKNGADYLNSREQFGYNAQLITTPIFKNKALPIMIDKGCLEMTPGGEPSSRKFSYSTSSEYEQAISDNGSIAIDAEGSYGAITMNAGFEMAISSSSSSQSTTSYAYGETNHYNVFGLLDNRCFSNSWIDIIVDNKLVKDDYVKAWEELRTRSYSSINSSTFDATFKKVVDAGLMIPTSYIYAVEAEMTTTSRFKSTGHDSAEEISTAINAGLAADTGTASGSLQTRMERVIETKKKELNIESTITVSGRVKGGGGSFTTSCFDNNSCIDTVSQQSNNILRDLNKLQPPSNHKTFITMDDFVKRYFGGTRGFPVGFYEAVNQYFTYETCEPICYKQPYLPTLCFVTIKTYLGDGKEIATSSITLQNCQGPSRTCSQARKFIHVNPRDVLCKQPVN